MIPLATRGTHIMGGDLYYHHITEDSFRITMRYFVDCVNGNASAISSDKIAYFGFFDAKTNSLITTHSVVRTGPVKVSEINYKCVTNLPNACVDQYEYTFTKKIDPGENGIIVSFQRCCRNYTISNLYDPGGTGMTLMAFIPPKGVVNDNPVFKSLPPNFLCNDAPLVFDHSATDADGDSLEYELYNPFLGASSLDPQPSQPSRPPYAPVAYLSPYNVMDMMGGKELLKIDRSTGLLTVFPNEEGQFVVGIKAIEYRDGKVIGMSYRDYQFNVLYCKLTVKAKFEVPQITCKTTSVAFVNSSDSSDVYHWDFGIGNLDSDTSNLKNPVYTYLKSGDYSVKLIAQKANCSDSVTHSFSIGGLDILSADFTVSPNQICVGDTVFITDNSSKASDWYWSFSDNTPLLHNVKTTFHQFTEDGDFEVKLQLFDTAECTLNDTATRIVHVIKRAVKSPLFSAESNDVCHPSALILNMPSEEIKHWKWEIESDSGSFEDRVTVLKKFENPGNYFIRITPLDTPEYCTTFPVLDTFLYVESVETPEAKVTLYNIYTPNDDGFNECFSPGLDPAACYSIRWRVYNRWGELFFKSDEDGACWNGLVRNNQHVVPAGTYFALYELMDESGKEIDSISGTITLIR